LDKSVLKEFVSSKRESSQVKTEEIPFVKPKSKGKLFEISDKLLFSTDTLKLQGFRNLVLFILGIFLFCIVNYVLPFHTSDFVNIQELVSTKELGVSELSNANVRNVNTYNSSFSTAAYPDVTANEVFIFDLQSQQLFFRKDIDATQPIASITKLMTTMVLLDNYKLEDTIEFNGDFTDYDNSLGLVDGDKILVADVVKALLISSYNDVAEGVANSFPGGSEAFFKKMDEKASVIGLTNSQFRTASGLFDDRNYSTARDVKKIAQVAITYPYIMEIARRSNDIVMVTHKSGSQELFSLYTTNQLLLNYDEVRGLKTGYTYGAGQCFVGYYSYSNTQQVISIVLGSESRFTETDDLVSTIGN
jgi:D-alanyl-D-alanine carboxypeptidase